MRLIKLFITFLLVQFDRIFKTDLALKYRLWLDTRRILKEWSNHLDGRFIRAKEADLVKDKAHKEYLWQKTEDSIKRS